MQQGRSCILYMYTNLYTYMHEFNMFCLLDGCAMCIQYMYGKHDSSPSRGVFEARKTKTVILICF